MSPPGADDATGDVLSSVEMGLPVRTLVGFDKVHLQPGEAATVAIDVRAEHLTTAQQGGGRRGWVGRWQIWLGSNNDDGVQVELLVG